jgi:alkanesulfonate monooxygenase SsuD/methylene tetrahydromethanopterin reductase-like flavin-dependent oxidoreductase (luciferase family)
MASQACEPEKRDLAMRCGFISPSNSLQEIVKAGIEAEAAGWDGFFYYDGFAGSVDPWVALAAIAVQTRRIRLGAVLVPLAWRRPWLVARAHASLDQLSNGRMILPVGLGAVEDDDWERGTTRTGEIVDRKVRATLLDEGLTIIERMWSGEKVKHEGEHYRLDIGPVGNVPVQRPRVPIWVVGQWGSNKSMRRVLRYDGWLRAGTSAKEMPEVKAYLAEHRPADNPLDVIVEGETPGDDPARAGEIVRKQAESGATWWLETRWDRQDNPDEIMERIRQGPPRP